MESLDPEAYFDGLLNFSDDEGDKISRDISLRSNELSNSFGSGRPFHFDDIGKEEEELEWISNKDSFPAVESLADILSDHPGSGVAALKLHSPVSVLEGEGSGSSSSNDSNNTNTTSTTTLTSCFGGLKPPRRARSKRRCRRRRGSYFDLTGKQQCLSIKHCGDRYIDTVKAEKAKEKAAATKKKTMKSTTMMMMTAKTMTTTMTGRKCQHCGAEKTPQWRAGPYGPKTLCNACGVRYKSGRLVPEYRPASSPSFSSELHSNSHRKIIEMRKVKNMVGMVVNNPAESG